VITDPAALKVVFWVLIPAAALLYVAAHVKTNGSAWHRGDFVRMLIPSLAFVAWTMLQKSTAFDAVAPEMSEAARALIGAGLASLLGVIAGMLAYRADGSHEEDAETDDSVLEGDGGN
jgi:hypothetical protein